jgi:hypothetical protein
MRTTIVGALLLVGTALAGAQTTARGVVYLDVNGNGRRDPGEAGVAGVAVSNQHDVARTLGDGTFELSSRPTGIVFVSVPDGHRAVGKFWRGAADADLEFGLARATVAESWSFVHASDTHIQASAVARTDRLRALVDSLRPALVLISGDLVRDALRVPESEARGYYELFVRERARFTVPVWTVPGNHELFGIERMSSLVSPTHPLYARGMYRHYLGPDYYSFTHGGIHFVALNTVDHDDLWYYGNVDSVQLAWLERDLAAVPADMPVVTFNHIPFFTSSESMRGYDDGGPAPTVIRVRGQWQFRHNVANARQALERLWRRPYPLALGGHIHLREKIEYGFGGQATRFEQAAAVVGGWTDGPISGRSGVTFYRVTRGKIDAGEFVPLDPPAVSR